MTTIEIYINIYMMYHYLYSQSLLFSISDDTDMACVIGYHEMGIYPVKENGKQEDPKKKAKG